MNPILNFNPVGFVKVSSAPVISFDHTKKGIPLNSWLMGTFKRGEQRQAEKNKRTEVLVLVSPEGEEFAVGTTPHIRNAFESLGCTFADEEKEGSVTDLAPAVGRFFAFKNLGKVEGKRYFNIECHVAPPGYTHDEAAKQADETAKVGSKKK